MGYLGTKRWNVTIHDADGTLLADYYDGDVEKFDRDSIYNTAHDSIYEFYRRDPDSVTITVEAKEVPEGVHQTGRYRRSDGSYTGPPGP